MKILVYDVAAEDGGGLFVLKDFYQDVLEHSPDNIEWLFLTSIDLNHLFSNKDKCFSDSFDRKIFSVHSLVYPSIKKTWIHRIAFENFMLPNIIRSFSPDLVISLQNMPIKGFAGKQFVYLHQSLQYCPKKYSFFKRDERWTAIRQHFICGVLYKHSLPYADNIFVQTNWIKAATQSWINCSDEKITVVPVVLNSDKYRIKSYSGQKTNTFFYPARAEKYKNHKIVIEACRILFDRGVKNFKVLFTLDTRDGNYSTELMKLAKDLPISFVGKIDYEKIWDYYSQTILLFPSYLETCGLPLLEAKASGSKILASDLPYSHEALDAYPNAHFFTFDDPDCLADKMEYLLNSNEYYEIDNKLVASQESLLSKMLERVEYE